MIQAKIVNGVPHVSATDARRNLATIVDEILSEFPKVVVENAGKPWCVIHRANGEDNEVRTFGEPENA
mgnify:CR=1 FL=1